MIEAAIVGAGEAPYKRHSKAASTESVLVGAVSRALRNSGFEPSEIDGLGIASFTLAPDHAIDLAWKLGLRLRWIMEDTNGGAAALNLLQHARRAVEAGDANAVLLLAGDLFQPEDFSRLVDNYNAATRDHLAAIPYGGPNSLFALLTQRHMAEHGLGRQDYGRVVIAQREWASLNPGAVYRSPLTMDEYLSAPLVADPLGRYDCVPVVAGADAVVVTASANVRRKPPVAIRAIAASYNDDHQEGDGLRTGLAELAPALWADAGLEPGDIDVASVYDDYPVMVLIQLSDLSFVRGDLGEFVRNRIATRSLPVNTSGGQLSAGQAGAAGGMHGLVEAVRQLRREARGRQVPQARTALVSGYGMVLYRYGACANAAVLERLP